MTNYSYKKYMELNKEQRSKLYKNYLYELGSHIKEINDPFYKKYNRKFWNWYHDKITNEVE
jgi:hypothetical protein